MREQLGNVLRMGEMTDAKGLKAVLASQHRLVKTMVFRREMSADLIQCRQRSFITPSIISLFGFECSEPAGSVERRCFSQIQFDRSFPFCVKQRNDIIQRNFSPCFRME